MNTHAKNLRLTEKLKNAKMNIENISLSSCTYMALNKRNTL